MTDFAAKIWACTLYALTTVFELCKVVLSFARRLLDGDFSHKKSDDKSERSHKPLSARNDSGSARNAMTLGGLKNADAQFRPKPVAPHVAEHNPQYDTLADFSDDVFTKK
ncbi:hypothetical protein AAVH_07538 [Aphelenchoides avenae]|nr:hypothetical protein AAVH_07538 [Aphelenchus avenae]